jgi:toxin ParE1/3/4
VDGRRISDVRHSWDYIATDNETAADRVVDRIEAAIALLDGHPHIGRAGQEPGTRELVVARTHYIAIYRVMGHAVEILRVLHAKQSWPPKG